MGKIKAMAHYDYEQLSAQEQSKRRASIIKEYHMGSGADKDWEERDNEISKSLYGEQILNNPSLKAGVYAQMDARDAYLDKERSDGSSASYYELPDNASELQDLISHRNMNAQIGEVFRECYRYGKASHSDEMRGIKKILFYAKAELVRLQNFEK